MQCQSPPLLRTNVFQEEFIELAQQLCARSCARVAIHKFVGVVGGELDRFPLKKEAGSRAVSCCIMVSALLPRIPLPTLQVSYPAPPRIYCAAPVFAVTGEHLISKIVDYKVATELLKRIIPVSCTRGEFWFQKDLCCATGWKRLTTTPHILSCIRPRSHSSAPLHLLSPHARTH